MAATNAVPNNGAPSNAQGVRPSATNDHQFKMTGLSQPQNRSDLPPNMAHGFPPAHGYQTFLSSGYQGPISAHRRSGMVTIPGSYSSIVQQTGHPALQPMAPRGVQPTIPHNFQTQATIAGPFFNGNLPQSTAQQNGQSLFNGLQALALNSPPPPLQAVALNGPQPTMSAIVNIPAPVFEHTKATDSMVKDSPSSALTNNPIVSLAVPGAASTSNEIGKGSASPAKSTSAVGTPTSASPAVAINDAGPHPPPPPKTHRQTTSSISSLPSWLHDRNKPSPYSLTLNPLQLIQRDLHLLSPNSSDNDARTKLYHYLHNGWNAMIEMNNKIFNERTRCRLCGQTPRTEHSYRDMNHGFSRKASALWRELQKVLAETNPEHVSLEDMEEFYEMYWEVERVFWEDDSSVVCGVGSWTGYQG